MQVVKGGDATPFMISPTLALSRSPGTGKMLCCAHNHVKIDTDGVQRPVPCRKDRIAPSMLKMLQSRRAYHLGLDDLINFRMWTALVPNAMKGLPSVGMPLLPRSVEEFLAHNKFSNPHEEVCGSGYTPLIFSVISGNLAVVRELITRHSVNVKAPVMIDLPKFGFEKGMDALAFAVGSCSSEKVYESVSLLLAAGADPNTAFNSGATPLMAAIMWHSLAGIRALISCSGGKLDLEKGLRANNATALLVAANIGTFEMVEALLVAGANREHK